jgi:hypothetical protein
MTMSPENLPAGGQRLWLAATTAPPVKVPSEMPSRIFRFEDYEDPAPMSPVAELALDVVEMMSKSGLTTVPRDPTDNMIAAAMEISGVTAEQASTIFKAMLAASDEDEVELADLAH